MRADDGQVRRTVVVLLVAAGLLAASLPRVAIDASVRRHEALRTVVDLADEQGWQLRSDTSRTPGLLPLSIAGAMDEPIARTLVYDTGAAAAEVGPLVEQALFGPEGWPQLDEVHDDDAFRRWEPEPRLEARGVEWRTSEAVPVTGRARARGEVSSQPAATDLSLLGYPVDPGWLRRLRTVRVEVVDGAVIVDVRGGNRVRQPQDRVGAMSPPWWSLPDPGQERG